MTIIKQNFIKKCNEILKSNKVEFITYWSQPLNGTTTQKFDKIPNEFEIESILNIKEIDASSLPSGGLRSTHQAKGLLIPDFNSNPYYYNNSIYIPSSIQTYHGLSIDYKSPLLKSIQRLESIATKIFNEIFSNEVDKVYPTLGIEQEFFLINEELYNKRSDLVFCGRTLYGNLPPKHQQLEDQYFGHIPNKINQFFNTLFQKCNQTSINITTKHLEVAPKQYETTLNHSDANTAIDNNLFLMTLIADSAFEHNLASLFHEKPFMGINGSGKHCNWSLMTSNGDNILDINKTKRIIFITYFINIIKAIKDYEELLRASIGSYSNDLRLGGNEAPPSIISVYTGEQLSDENILFNLNSNISNSDRNRTSPLPFNENKFEFRSVGSYQNPSFSITCLNTIIAKTLEDFYISLNKDYSETNILNKLKSIFNNAKSIIYNENCYSQEWVNEANKRGISNHVDTLSALNCLSNNNIIELFDGILNKEELNAIKLVKEEEYHKHLKIELKTINDWLINQTNNKKIINNSIKIDFNRIDQISVDWLKKTLNDYRNLFNEYEWKTPSNKWYLPKLIDILK